MTAEEQDQLDAIRKRIRFLADAVSTWDNEIVELTGDNAAELGGLLFEESEKLQQLLPV